MQNLTDNNFFVQLSFVLYIDTKNYVSTSVLFQNVVKYLQ